MSNDRQEITPRNEDSFARTLRSNEYPSRNSNRGKGHLVDTPTDESTLPNPRANVMQSVLSSVRPSSNISSQRLDSLPRSGFLQKSMSNEVSGRPFAHSTPKSQATTYVEEHDNHMLIEHLQNSITVLEAHMFLIDNHAKEQMERLNREYKHREEQLNIAIDMVANDRVILEQEKTDLSTQLANTRVDLKLTKDQLRQEKSRHSGDTQDLNQKLKAMSDERIKLQSELSGLKVKFNDARRAATEQKNQIETLEAKLKKANDNNSKLTTANAQVRIHNERLQQRVDQLEKQLRQVELSRQTPDSAESAPIIRRSSLSGSRQNLSARSFNDNRPATAPTERQSRPTSSLRFSNRTQVRDITPPPFSSLVENEEPGSPQGIGSEIHTTSCRDNCHLFEHEGDEGRFRWVCGTNENLFVLYREQRYVIFVPGVAEIQFFGDGPSKGQVVIFWTSLDPIKEITVLHTSGVREEYRVGTDGGIVCREVFNFEGPVFRITGDETIQIDPSEATPLLAGVQVNQNSERDIQIKNQAFGLRIVNFEFLRVQIAAERLQINMCLCDNKRVFNVKHCSSDFTQRALCSFLGQCQKLPVR